jgi:hypothetical protein
MSEGGGDRPAVFITTNRRQSLAARVVAHSVRRNTKQPGAFDVRTVHQDDHPFLHGHDGRTYLRDGGRWTWLDDDTQTFMFLRFAVPGLMNHRGRAIVMDPDMFVVGDIADLLFRDMGGKAILTRRDRADGTEFTSSLMVLDCAKLTHWNPPSDFGKCFTFEHDYDRFIQLRYQDRSTFAFFEPGWNDYDRIEPTTMVLHNTSQRHQPWKTGLPLDYYIHGPRTPEQTAADTLAGRRYPVMPYEPHPDPRQERLFFALLRECLDEGSVTEAMVRTAIDERCMRTDAFELLARARPEDADPLGRGRPTRVNGR